MTLGRPIIQDNALLRSCALFVVGEPGADPAPTFASAPCEGPRFYAAPEGEPSAVRATERERSLAAWSATGEVAVLTEGSLGARIDEARRLASGRPLLLIAAGDRLAPRERQHAAAAPSRSRAETVRVTDDSRSIRLPVRWRALGRPIAPIPWFSREEPRLIPAAADLRGIAGWDVERDLGTLDDLLAHAVRGSTRDPNSRQPARPVTSVDLLGLPIGACVRAYVAGSWRDGILGYIIAALAGLSCLVERARAWRCDSEGSTKS